MGVEKNKRIEQNERRKGKGRSKRATAQTDYEVSLDTLKELAALVKVIADAGGAIRIGKTRDGGALALGIYMGDDYATEYVRPSEDIREAIEDIVAGWVPELADEYLGCREALGGA